MDFIKDIITHIFQGGAGGVIGVMMVFIAFLIVDRNRIINDSSEKDDKIEAIIEEYYKGTITISEAFNSLKLVLIEIKTKL